MAAASSSRSSVTDRRTDLASKPDCSALVGMVSVESVSQQLDDTQDTEQCLSPIYSGQLLTKLENYFKLMCEHYGKPSFCQLSFFTVSTGSRQGSQYKQVLCLGYFSIL